jgi:secreted Zn-dependent insulinase-like peptidase
LFSKLSALLQPLNPEADQLAAILAATSFEDFVRFSASMFKQLHLEALMLGNWTESNVQALQQQLQQWLSHTQGIGSKLPKQSYSTAMLGPVWLELPIRQDDHALVIYLPARQRSAHNMALFMLMNHLVSPEYFHALRTEQQLGYLVGTGYVPMNLKPGIAFYVQSPKVAPSDLYYATLIFYRKFLEELPELTNEEFDEFKQSLQGQIKERDNGLSSRAKRIWLAIGQGDENCQLACQIQQELALLTLPQFIEFCYTLLAPDYDAIFLATGPAPQHSHMQQLSIQELKGRLQLQQDEEHSNGQ